VVRARVEMNLPRKRGNASAGYDKALESFFGRVLQAIVRYVDWDVVKCLVIAGPGFTKDKFREFLDLEAVRQDIRCGIHGAMTDLAPLYYQQFCKFPQPNFGPSKLIAPPRHVLLVLFDRPLITNKSRIVVAAASSAYKHSLQELIASPAIVSRIKVGLMLWNEKAFLKITLCDHLWQVSHDANVSVWCGLAFVYVVGHKSSKGSAGAA
jgi:protein pelota